MILPSIYEGQDWFPSFDRFIAAFDPDWYRTYDCAPSTPPEIEEAEEYVRPECSGLPPEYVDFLARMGGRGLDLRERAQMYALNHIFLTEGKVPCLNIGGYDPYDEGDRLAFRFSPEGSPDLVWRDRMTGGKPVKVADSLGQVLCNQAFLAYGTGQFPIRYPMELAFHLHQPPYRPCPEAEEYCRTHSLEGLAEEDVWDIGFQIQLGRLEGPLKELGYERAWFSTELDHIWIQADTCCILSRNFDPNDMFDTLMVSLWGMDREVIRPLAARFRALGYGNYLELREGST